MPTLTHHNGDTQADIQIDHNTLLTIQEHIFVARYSNHDHVDLRDTQYPINFDDFDWETT